MTTISSPTQTVSFGGLNPTAIVGERINPTGKARLMAALQRSDFGVVESEAKRQVLAGATVLDVNVGAPGVDEPVVLRRAVEIVAGVTDVPLCIDSSSPSALAAALSVYKGKALVNSVTAEDRSLNAVLPIVRDHGAAIVGLLQNDEGIPPTIEGRLDIARRILDRALAMGIPQDDLVIDCICLTAGADPSAPVVTFQALQAVTQKLGLSTILGASNISFGLPGRRTINATFLGMAIGAGLSAAIVDPTIVETMDAIMIADMLAGRDDYAMRYITYFRAKPQA